MFKLKKCKHPKLIYALWCLIISFIILMFCSKNSFLYCFNDWYDENAFFTMGRGWLSGLVPYRDLFEQKGPLLYLIFAILSFVSSKSFIAIFIFEILSGAVFLYYVGKIVDLFIGKQFKYLISPIFFSIVCASLSFVHGGSAEEFCLPLLMITFYHFMIFIKSKDQQISNKTLFIDGLMAGLIAMIKYNLLGFHFIYMAMIFLVYLFRKELFTGCKKCLFFLLGMILPIIPFIIYFWQVGALENFINAYVLYNVNSYTAPPLFGIFGRIFGSIILSISGIFHNTLIFMAFCFFIYYFIISNKFIKKLRDKIMLIFLMFFMGFGIYYGLVSWQYYVLPFVIFIILGFIGVFSSIEQQKLNESQSKWLITGTILCVIIICLTNKNIYALKLNKDDYAQYRFAKIINEEKNPTLLNYGFLDGGFHLASGVEPTIPYFERQNGTKLGLVQNRKEQWDAVKNKKVKFVVTKKNSNHKPDVKILVENYNKVSTFLQNYEGKIVTYDLWKLK